MRTAIRKHLPDFLAIIGLLVIAVAVATVILGKQRLALPAWVPVVGKDFFVIEAEMSTAQAVTPGQGQTVNVAGVEVGEIASVKLRDGKAIIGMKIQPRYARIYKDASVLLRPKTGLKDMVAELTPGTKEAGQLEEGAVIPVSQTLPDVNLDEILATLDADTRDYLAAAAQRRRRGPRLRGQGPAAGAGDPAPGADREVRARDQRAAGRAAQEPGARRAQLLAADRRARPARHAARELRPELQRGLRHAGLARTSRCAQILQKLPGTLQTTQETLGKVDTFAQVLGPTLESLRPAARALGPSLRQTRPFLRESTPIIRDEIRPFTRAALPTVQELRPAMRDLAAVDAGPDGVVLGPQPAAEHVRLQPAGRPRGGLPLLAVVGQPRRQRDLLDRRRARPDPARPGRAVVLERAAAGRRRGRQPAAGHDHRAAQRAVGRRRSARSRRRRPASGGTGG